MSLKPGPKLKRQKSRDALKRQVASVGGKSISGKSASTMQKPLKPKPRYVIAMPKREHVFKVRNSLAEYVDSELNEQGTSVYYQRVFILAKNIARNVGRAEGSIVSGVTTTTVQSGAIDELASAMAAATAVGSSTTNLTVTTAGGGTTAMGITPTASPTESATRFSTQPLIIYGDEQVTKTFTFPIVEDDVEDEKPPEEELVVVEKAFDFFDLFMAKLKELSELCTQKTYTPDPLSGLFLYMGDYTLLMIESTEDLIGTFCKELAEVSSQFWLKDRIFQIEDKITETYFPTIIGRRIPAAFINEKFPTSTPNDEYLMAKQHIIIKEKINLICLMLSDELREFEIQLQLDDVSSTSSFVNVKTPKKNRISENLPLEPYRKLLPELQRIELVLSSQRFYFTLDEFALIYGTVPVSHDDESSYWPEQNNYLPPNIFEHSEFDVNLTFGDYGKDLKRSTVESNRPTLIDGEEPNDTKEPAVAGATEAATETATAEQKE